jgi:hypothetical protein
MCESQHDHYISAEACVVQLKPKLNSKGISKNKTLSLCAYLRKVLAGLFDGALDPQKQRGLPLVELAELVVLEELRSVSFKFAIKE